MTCYGSGSAPGPDYRRLFEASPTPKYVIDRDFVIVAVSDAYVAATNIERDQLIGKTPFDIFPANSASSAALHSLRLSLDKVLATGRPDTMAIQRFDIPGDGGTWPGERYWSSVNAPVLDDQGRVIYIIRRVVDATAFVRRQHDQEQRQGPDKEWHGWERADWMEGELIATASEIQAVNRQLLAANEELARQQAVKDRFIATLSHELRNPLAAITAAIELLELDLPSGHPALTVLERQSHALVRITGDLLDSSRAQTGRLTLTRERLDLRAVIDSAVQDMTPAYREAGLALRAAAPGRPVPVNGDRIRLAQMLTNLLRNAWQHSRPGGTVSVTLDNRGDHAAVTVRDNGEGFDPAQSQSLFEMFGRPAPPGTAASSPGPGPGLGLGLGLVRAIAELHGGSVTAHSPGPHHGAQFRVRLPLAAPGSRPSPAAPDPAAPDPAAPPAPGTLAPPRPRRVLIIEDNTDLARSYQALLARRGDSVQTAASGRDGLAAASALDFDLIICDIALPDMDGCEVARRLRRQPRAAALPLIALSGFSQPSDQLRSLRAGFNAHLAKPLRLADLDDAITAVPAKP